MNRMTRNEAAKYLGVSSQTISNLIKRNVLFEIKDNVSKMIFVNAEDVVRYKSSYKVISAEEKNDRPSKEKSKRRNGGD